MFSPCQWSKWPKENYNNELRIFKSIGTNNKKYAL